jgi:hypothetical protein
MPNSPSALPWSPKQSAIAFAIMPVRKFPEINSSRTRINSASSYVVGALLIYFWLKIFFIPMRIILVYSIFKYHP